MSKGRVLFIVFLLVLILAAAGSIFPLMTLPSLIRLVPVSEPASLALSIDDQPSLPLSSNAAVVQKVAPAVVSILAQGVTQAEGTGLIVSSNGYIATNNHVVETATTIRVTLSDNSTFTASLIGTDPLSDLAVVKIAAENLPSATFLKESLNQSYVGDDVIAIGNALARGIRVTKGVISSLGSVITINESTGFALSDLIETDAAIYPGNSGGPLVNMAGQVIGINTAIIAGTENFGYAISTNTIIPVVESLISRGYVVRPYLGITMETVTPLIAYWYNLAVDQGVRIKVVAGSPASNAGLRTGDVIIRFAGQEVTTSEELRRAIQSKNIGDLVEIVLMRGSNQLTFQAILGQSPTP